MIYSFLLLILVSGMSASGCVTIDRVGYLRVADSRVTLLSGKGELILRSPELIEELRNLDGARVDVVGTVSGRRVRVVGYRLLDPGNGMQPYVGQLTIGQLDVSVYDIALGRRYTLARPLPVSIFELHGAKVWITGEVVGTDLIRVADFGIIRPPEP